MALYKSRIIIIIIIIIIIFTFSSHSLLGLPGLFGPPVTPNTTVLISVLLFIVHSAPISEEVQCPFNHSPININIIHRDSTELMKSLLQL